ncbi:MAG: 30S ribosomal protein S14 [Bdellovibrionaceae bacterium]|nr:30S ribosomal protein S14 [Pseudobdellovibrionaceae bacterium]
MAKKSSIAKNNQKYAKALKYTEHRKSLRAQSIDPSKTDEERYEAFLALQKLPRNTSVCRVTRRCYLTGRARGIIRKFGLSRLAMRELALQGKLPGVTKASW